MNNSSTSVLTTLCLISLALGVAGARQMSSKPGAAKVSVPYSKVSPLIAAKCMTCHNDKRHPEAINLSTFQTLMKSGEHGPIVIPGHPEQSKLIKYVDGEKQPRMPFHKAPLSSAEINTLKRWISAGAKG